jgi:site-specific recombinase XerD
MLYSSARVSAVLKLKVDDYYHSGARRRLRLHEKGGKEHYMPVHHLLEQIPNEYIQAAGLPLSLQLLQNCLMLINTILIERTIEREDLWERLSAEDLRAHTAVSRTYQSVSTVCSRSEPSVIP